MTLEAVILALRESWGPDTCAPEDVADWTPDNPARGQCATTALVLHDFFGGSLVTGEVFVDPSTGSGAMERVDFHWWNRLPDGEQVDITLEQFGPHEHVVGGIDVLRPTGSTRLDQQYALLSARVSARLAQSWGSPQHTRA
ncbi:YunG family protein [Aeromicrobium ginsengisoli]|uniref:Uncharacterized protein n=1 Tax=Aeromicrobium ginsengisoli TaxID=363867 RepID=A0A5M4FBU9_9ACTN|nr:hypothetical protein [Aeromicrobium ginsengisoli]KAA1395775.1 hypothetical protein ESP70_016690 [Aeromicrobium ginsengisoli]